MESLSPNARLMREIEALSEEQIRLAHEELEKANLKNNAAQSIVEDEFMTEGGFELVTRKRKINVRSADKIVPTPEKKGRRYESAHPIKNLQNEKKENLPPLIIDNINKKFQSEEDIRKELQRCNPHIKISKIKKLPKGGILIFPETSADYNRCLKDWPEDSFESKIKVHVPASQDTRPSLCINKYSLESNIEKVKENLDKKDIKIDELRRLTNYKGRESTLIIFKVENEKVQNFLETNGVQIEGISYTVRKYLKKDTQVIRCINCQRLGHSNNNCKFEKRCVRCGGKSCEKECKRGVLKCSNCNEPHSSAYKGCRAYHQAIKENEHNHKLKTYAEITKSKDIKIEKEINAIKSNIQNKQDITPTDLIIITTEAIVRTKDMTNAFDILKKITSIITNHFHTNVDVNTIASKLINHHDSQL